MQSVLLGKRLSTLDQNVSSDYQHIWDVCCDHGLLGMALLERKAAPVIHFVDVVPDLIGALNEKLKEHSPSPSVNMLTGKPTALMPLCFL